MVDVETFFKNGEPRERKPRKPISGISDKQKVIKENYLFEREVYLRSHPRCEIRWDVRCTDVATEVDHIVNRSQRRDLVDDPTNFQSGCSYCHRMKTLNPKEAKARGLSKSAWDNEPERSDKQSSSKTTRSQKTWERPVGS